MGGSGWKRDLDEHVSEARRLGRTRRDEATPRFGGRPLASSVDLLSRHATIRDQKETSACVGFALAGAVEARLRLIGYEPEAFSPLFSYALARQLEGVGSSGRLVDDGCHPFLAMAGCRRFGVVSERAWPFDGGYAQKVRQEVPFDVIAAASGFRVTDFERIEDRGLSRVRACKAALNAGHPVLLGMMVGRAFADYRRGLGPVGIERDDVAGHMTYLVGYEEDGDVFLGVNSWGGDYGDGGLYRITSDKLGDESTSDLYDFTVAAEG